MDREQDVQDTLQWQNGENYERVRPVGKHFKNRTNTSKEKTYNETKNTKSRRDIQIKIAKDRPYFFAKHSVSSFSYSSTKHTSVSADSSTTAHDQGESILDGNLQQAGVETPNKRL